MNTTMLNNIASMLRPSELPTTMFIIVIVDPSDEIHVFQRRTVCILAPSMVLEEAMRSHGLMFDNPFLPVPPASDEDEDERMTKLQALAFSQNFLVKITELL